MHINWNADIIENVTIFKHITNSNSLYMYKELIIFLNFNNKLNNTYCKIDILFYFCRNYKIYKVYEFLIHTVNIYKYRNNVNEIKKDDVIMLHTI